MTTDQHAMNVNNINGIHDATVENSQQQVCINSSNNILLTNSVNEPMDVDSELQDMMTNKLNINATDI